MTKLAAIHGKILLVHTGVALRSTPNVRYLHVGEFGLSFFCFTSERSSEWRGDYEIKGAAPEVRPECSPHGRRFMPLIVAKT